MQEYWNYLNTQRLVIYQKELDNILMHIHKSLITIYMK